MSYRSPLGLDRAERRSARQRAVRAAMLTYYNRESVHYTQGANRWEGIRRGLRSGRGQYPRYADCSSLLSWIYWDATRPWGLGDFVNGHSWQAGFTGTMTRHGRNVDLDDLLTGDAVFYGGSWSTPGHVAIYVGHGRVVSHGSERGPLLVATRYRPVLRAIRYIR